MLKIDFRKVQSGIEQIRKGTDTATTAAMKPVLFQLKRDADEIEPKTPHKTGHLRANVIYKITKDEGSLTFKQPYAERWHETEKDIKWSEAGVGPKYLEKKINRFYGKYIVKAAGIIKGVLKI